MQKEPVFKRLVAICHLEAVSLYMLSCTTKKCQNWHFLVVMAWRHELNLLPLHYQKVPILAKIRNDMEEIKRDRYLKQLIDSQQNGFIKSECQYLKQDHFKLSQLLI